MLHIIYSQLDFICTQPTSHPALITQKGSHSIIAFYSLLLKPAEMISYEYVWVNVRPSLNCTVLCVRVCVCVSLWSIYPYTILCTTNIAWGIVLYIFVRQYSECVVTRLSVGDGPILYGNKRILSDRITAVIIFVICLCLFMRFVGE